MEFSSPSPSSIFLFYVRILSNFELDLTKANYQHTEVKVSKM